jgi:hypothetical protein
MDRLKRYRKVEIVLVLIPGIASDPRYLNFGLVLSCALATALESDSSCRHHFDKAKCGLGSETRLKYSS